MTVRKWSGGGDESVEVDPESTNGCKGEEVFRYLTKTSGVVFVIYPIDKGYLNNLDHL